jgi:hypothetical protein
VGLPGGGWDRAVESRVQFTNHAAIIPIFVVYNEQKEEDALLKRYDKMAKRAG